MNRLLFLGTKSDNSTYLRELAYELTKYDDSLEIQLIDPNQFNRYIFDGEDFVSIKSSKKWNRFMMSNKYISKAFSILFGMFYFILLPKNKFQSISIQFVSPLYAFWAPIINRKTPNFSAVFWGSDLLRLPRNAEKKVKYVTKKVGTIITGSNDTAEIISNKFPQTERKVRVVNFGNAKLTNLLNKTNESNEKGTYDDVITIGIGYNASEAQQHIAVIDVLKGLDESVKQRIRLLLPMTYPKNEAYLEQVKDSLEKSGINYTIYTEYLSEAELLELRKDTDIYLNMQKTDMFSASVHEYLSLGSVVFNADWLPYSYVEENGIFDLKTNWDSLKGQVEDVVNNLETYKSKTENNFPKIQNLISWENLIPRWAKYLNITK